jgi:DNA-binding NtrC family response regulator
MSILKRYAWPGNVRELERCIERTVVFAESDEIRPEDISEEILQAVEASGPGMRARSPGQTLPMQVAAFERLLIEEAMREEGGVKSRAARRLGIHEATIRKKLRDYGIGKSPE